MDTRTFHFDTCLGAGGFGEVYRAAMTTTGGLTQVVAVKMLRSGLAPASQSVERLRDEGRMLARLQHPVILGVHDMTVIEGRVALVTEYVEGQDLDACFTGEAPLPSRALLQVIGQVADALHSAWEALTLVHRDIKPSNIRLGTHGQVKLLDFGIARSEQGGREAHTATNMMVGSLPYMAPERFATADIQPAADVFALGCCLFEGLTGGEMLFGELTAPMMAGLALDKERYGAWLEERLQHVPPTVLDSTWELLADCLAWAPEERPAPDALARRCEVLADEMVGPTLRRWAAQRAWPAVSPDEGELTGHVLSDLGTRSLPEPVAPSTGSMVSTRTVAVVGAGSLAVVLGGAAVVGLLAVGTGAWWWTAQSQAQGEPVALQAAVSEPAVAPSVASTAPSPVAATSETTHPAEAALPGDGTATPESGAVSLSSTPEAPRRRSSPAAAAPEVPAVQGSVAPEGAAEGTSPAVAPQPAPSAHFASAGPVVVSLRGAGGQRFAAGALPAGTYTVLADFGGGEVEAGRVQCEAGATCTVRCNALLGTCVPVEAP